MKAYVLKKKGSKEPPACLTASETVLALIEHARPGDLIEVLVTELNAPSDQLQLTPTTKEEKPNARKTL